MSDYRFKVRHIPSGKFMCQGSDGFLTEEGHVWDTKRGASLALSHVRRRCQQNHWRSENSDNWVVNADDMEVVKFILVEVREVID